MFLGTTGWVPIQVYYHQTLIGYYTLKQKVVTLFCKILFAIVEKPVDTLLQYSQNNIKLEEWWLFLLLYDLNRKAICYTKSLYHAHWKYYNGKTESKPSIELWGTLCICSLEVSPIASLFNWLSKRKI